jgi:hypothetical protein
MKPILIDFLRLNDNVTVHDYDLDAFGAALKKEHIRDCKEKGDGHRRECLFARRTAAVKENKRRM